MYAKGKKKRKKRKSLCSIYRYYVMYVWERESEKRTKRFEKQIFVPLLYAFLSLFANASVQVFTIGFLF